MAKQENTPTIYGVPIKYVSLLILVVQNSTLVLTMRYSRILPGPRYLSSTAVVLSELLKCSICFFIHLYDRNSHAQTSELPTLSDDIAQSLTVSQSGLRQLVTEIFGAKSGFVKLLIPAVLYTLQNNLQFVAATNLDAATFQVTYQCKILTTALFAVLLLRQSLSPKKWISLFILTVGVACVQIPSSSSTASIQHEGNYFIGLVAVAIACLCSGFAGVYFEKVLKNGNSTSIWIRNIQLSVGCLAIAITGALIWDGKAIAEAGFFQGYNSIVVATICIQAAGGLIVAMVIKYADNILKGFATSLSIILSTVASIFFFNFIVTIYFLIGTALVLLATYLYSASEEPRTKPQDVNIEETTPMIDNDFQNLVEKNDHENTKFHDGEDRKSRPEDSYSEKDAEIFEHDPDTFSPSLTNQSPKGKGGGKVYDELGLVQ